MNMRRFSDAGSVGFLNISHQLAGFDSRAVFQARQWHNMHHFDKNSGRGHRRPGPDPELGGDADDTAVNCVVWLDIPHRSINRRDHRRPGRSAEINALVTSDRSCWFHHPVRRTVAEAGFSVIQTNTGFSRLFSNPVDQRHVIFVNQNSALRPSGLRQGKQKNSAEQNTGNQNT